MYQDSIPIYLTYFFTTNPEYRNQNYHFDPYRMNGPHTDFSVLAPVYVQPPEPSGPCQNLALQHTRLGWSTGIPLFLKVHFDSCPQTPQLSASN